MAADLALSCDAGDHFPSLFYSTLDNNRNMLNGFYTDKSTLVWNGNVRNGIKEVTQFYQNLPNSTHDLHSVDCQPMRFDPQGDPLLLVSCAGQVTFGGHGNPSAFTHQFILNREGEIWKVTSETFRCNVGQN